MNELENKINAFLDRQVIVLSTNEPAKIIGISKSGICIEMIEDKKRYTYTNGPRNGSNPFLDGFLQFEDLEDQKEFIEVYQKYTKQDGTHIFGIFFF